MYLKFTSLFAITTLLTCRTTTASPLPFRTNACLQVNITDFDFNGHLDVSLSLNSQIECSIPRYANTTSHRDALNWDTNIPCLKDGLNAILQRPVAKGGPDGYSVFVKKDADDGIVVNVELLLETKWAVEDGVRYRTYYGELGC